MDAKQQAMRISLLAVSGLLFGAAGSAWLSSQSPSAGEVHKNVGLPIRKVVAEVPQATVEQTVESKNSTTPATTMWSAAVAARQSAGRQDPSAPLQHTSSAPLQHASSAPLQHASSESSSRYADLGAQASSRLGEADRGTQATGSSDSPGTAGFQPAWHTSYRKQRQPSNSNGSHRLIAGNYRGQRSSYHLPPPPAETTYLGNPPEASAAEARRALQQYAQATNYQSGYNYRSAVQPERPKVLTGRDMHLVGLLDNKAIFSLPRRTARYLNLPESVTLAPGQQWHGVKVVAVTEESATVSDGSSPTITKTLRSIR